MVKEAQMCHKKILVVVFIYFPRQKIYKNREVCNKFEFCLKSV